LLHGQAVSAATLEPTDETLGTVRVYGPEGEFLGIGELRAAGELIPRRLMASQSQSNETAN
jgi:hypothetical protein